MNPCRCAYLLTLAGAVVLDSLTHSFDQPHTHVPVAGEWGTFPGTAAILASSASSGRAITGTGALTVPQPTVSGTGTVR